MKALLEKFFACWNLIVPVLIKNAESFSRITNTILEIQMWVEIDPAAVKGTNKEIWGYSKLLCNNCNQNYEHK
jgi:hypothetical protein